MRLAKMMLLTSFMVAIPAILSAQSAVVSGGGGSGGGTGSVNSVAATVPSFMSVSGSPITDTGTLAFAFGSQAANLVFISPDGTSGAPTFRALASADIPSLAASKITGTALTATNNLSDLGSASTARTNLALGTLATQSGTFSGTSSGTNTGDQVVPANTTSAASQWFNAYNSSTGVFTKSQPAFSDISGSLSHSQLPTLLSGDIPNNAANTTGSAATLATARTINGDSFDGSGNIQNTLASADFANQGTTATILHGNAAGNPSFGSVVNADITANTIDVATKLTGTLLAAQEPAHTGDTTNTAGSLAMTTKQLHLTDTAITFASSPYAIVSADSVITCDASGGAVVINLPAASGSGRYITIKKIDSSSNACTPTRAGSDLIDGATSYGLTTQYAASNVIDTLSGVWSRGHVNQLGGDISGVSTNATVNKVNGVSYSASPSTDTVPVVTASNTATYSAVPNCTDTGGNHLNYTASTHTIACGTSSSGGGGITNAAGNNVITKSNGTNLVASGVSDDGTTVTTSEVVTQTSTSASAFVSGPNGSTNPGVKFDFSTASAATGLAIKPAASGSGIALNVLSSGSNESMHLVSKGTGGVFVPTGTAANPGLVFEAQSNGGWHARSGGSWDYSSGGSYILELWSAGIFMRSSACYGISADLNEGSGPDALLCRDAAASWQLGQDAATPVAQMFKAADARAGTDTNTAGSDLAIAPGRGTGTGVGGNLRSQSSFPVASGTGAGTLTDRDAIIANPKTLTESSATALCDISVPSGTVTGGTLFYTIEANDGTDFEVLRGSVPFEAVNKAGTLTTSMGTPIEISTGSSGVLTESPTITTGTNKITLNISATSTLIQTVLRATYRVALDGGSGAVSPL